MIQVQESDGLISLARKARRFFPAGSAAEIWQECRPLLADTNKPDAFLVSPYGHASNLAAAILTEMKILLSLLKQWSISSRDSPIFEWCKNEFLPKSYHTIILRIASTCMQGLNWLCVFMPTRAVKQHDGDWNAWLPEWINCWESMIHSSSWDCLWLTILSRLAKHDTEGSVPVSNHIVLLCIS